VYTLQTLKTLIGHFCIFFILVVQNTNFVSSSLFKQMMTRKMMILMKRLMVNLGVEVAVVLNVGKRGTVHCLHC
jgi:fatty acid desaturase